MSGGRLLSRGGKRKNSAHKNSPKRRGPRRKNVCHSCKSNHLKCEPVPPNDVHSPLCKRCMDEAAKLHIYVATCYDLASFLMDSSHNAQVSNTSQGNTFHSPPSGEVAQQQPIARPHSFAEYEARDVSLNDGDTLATGPPSLSQAPVPPFLVDSAHSVYSLQTQVSQAAQGVNSFPEPAVQMGISPHAPTSSNYTASPDRSTQLSSTAQWSGHDPRNPPYPILHPAWAYSGHNPTTPINYHSASFAQQRVTDVNPSHAAHDTYSGSSTTIPHEPNISQSGFKASYERPHHVSCRQEFQSNTDQGPSSLVVSIPSAPKGDIITRNPPSSATSVGSFPFTPMSGAGSSYMGSRGTTFADNSPNDNILVTSGNAHGPFYLMESKQSQEFL